MAPKKPDDEGGRQGFGLGSLIYDYATGKNTVQAHPDYKFKFKPDQPSSGSKIIDEARGSTVLGSPIKAIDRPATDAANLPKKKVVRSTPKRTTVVTKTPTSTVGYTAPKPARAEAPVLNWRGAGSEPVRKQRALFAGGGKSGSIHDTSRLKWFKGKGD